MIHEATEKDIRSVAALAVMLWPDNSEKELADEFAEYIGGSDSKVYIYSVNGEAAGFAHCQLRYDYVEGTETSPVGYLEGIFVVPEYRGNGIARELLEKCEQWAAARGCTEFASDCETDNTDSLKFHLKTGFTEANRIICFRKKIAD